MNRISQDVFLLTSLLVGITNLFITANLWVEIVQSNTQHVIIEGHTDFSQCKRQLFHSMPRI